MEALSNKHNILTDFVALTGDKLDTQSINIQLVQQPSVPTIRDSVIGI